MKKYIYLIISLLIVVIGSGIICFQNHKADNTVNCSGSVMCSAQSFQNTNDGAYLEITLDDEKHTKKKLAIKDENVIKKLNDNPIEYVIGVNLKATIPDKALEGKADYYIKDSIQLLIDYDDYDKYFEIVDVSFGEAPDVVKTYDATPEDKITEYIKNGELCYSATHYELSDGTWKVKELPYTYKYRLELTGRLHNAVKDSTYIILSNRNDITFEQAWKASGLSSNTEDYFEAKDAIIIGRK
ncbi:MAG: hypothetical protein IKI97_13065 [Clostridia bacterium]|nr:hypothetical protein [Clostridia bacterium]